MKFPLRSALAGLALLGVTAAHAAAPLNSLQMTFKETVTPTGQKARSHTSTIYLKKNRMRIEQQNMVILTDGKQSYLYSLKDPKKQVLVTEIPPDQRQTNITSQVTRMVGPMIRQMKKVGKGTVLGYATDIYQRTDPKTKETHKTWVATTVGAPLFLREERRVPKGSSVVEATALRINPSLADSLFAPPKGYKVVKNRRVPAGPPVSPGRPKR